MQGSINDHLFITSNNSRIKENTVRFIILCEHLHWVYILILNLYVKVNC